MDLHNPRESDAGKCKIVEIYEDKPYDDSAPYASEIAVYSLEMNEEKVRFDFGDDPIYVCETSEENLEAIAIDALVDRYDIISAQLSNARNYALSSRLPDFANAVVRVGLHCACGKPHQALFYCPFPIRPEPVPRSQDFLLADITGVDLSDVLDGVFSKTRLMNSVNKLIVRWRLFCEQIVIVSPFVGHQFNSKQKRLEIWERLLRQLDKERTVFVTRPATLGEYKSALLDSGLDYEMLETFGLENQIVSGGTKKQDFHAKLFIGLGDRSEVLSGSANIVGGPSMENASFKKQSRSRVEAKYFSPLKINIPPTLPLPSCHLFLDLTAESPKATIETGSAPG